MVSFLPTQAPRPAGGSVRAARQGHRFHPRIAAGDCTNPGFRQHCTGTFIRQGVVTVVVGQNKDGQLTLSVGSEPTYKLRPYQSRIFVIDELEGFRVEFHLGPDGDVNELIFHQPNGTFVARRA